MSIAHASPKAGLYFVEYTLDISYDEAVLLKLEQHIGRLLKEGFST